MWREQLALTDRRVHRCTAFTISHVVNIGGSIPPLASPTIGWRPATLRRGGGGAREELGVWSLVENRSDTELPPRLPPVKTLINLACAKCLRWVYG
jgi:hypothetical protein